MSAMKYRTAREEYLARLEREDIARAADNAELKACEQAREIMGWRKLAEAAIEAAETRGVDARCISSLRDWQDDLMGARTDEQWQELEEMLPF
jgi:hypothetical protein